MCCHRACKRLKAAPRPGGREGSEDASVEAAREAPRYYDPPHVSPFLISGRLSPLALRCGGQPRDRGMAGLLCSSLRGSAALQSFTANDRFWDGRDTCGRARRHAHARTHAHTEEAGACLSLGTPRKHMQAHTSHYQAQESMVPSSWRHRALRGRRSTCTHGSAHVGQKQRRGS